MVLLIALLIANTGYFIKYNTQYNVERFKVIKKELKAVNDGKYLVYTTDFNGAVYNLQDVNKDIKTINKIEEKDNVITTYNNMLKLIPENKGNNYGR